MTSQEILKRARNATCAVGVFVKPMLEHRKDPIAPDFRIVGTGFLVHDTVVMTNRHVLEDLYELEDKKGIPKDQFYVSFVYPRKGQEPNWQLTYSPIRYSGIAEQHGIDIGLIEISRHDTQPDFKQCMPLNFGDLSDIYIGAPVAMWGYPTGTDLLQPSLGLGAKTEEKLCRIGPVLQQGFISAGTPFEVEPGTNELLLDIRTYNGMSGSAVFLPHSGTVIGIHYKGNKVTTSVALPLDTNTVSGLLKNYYSAKEA